MGSDRNIVRLGALPVLSLLLLVGCSGDNPGFAPDAGAQDSAPSQKPPPAGLAGYWSFDKAGGLVQDESGNDNTATVHGARQIPGKRGLAYYFEGTSCITAPDSPSLDKVRGTALSMMAWINMVSGMTCPQDKLDMGHTEWGVILGKNGEYEHGVYCGAAPKYQESISTDGEGGGWTWHGDKPLPLNGWHHVATTWDGNFATHYVDGVPLEDRAVAGKLKAIFGITGLTIGCGNAQPDGTSPGGYNFFGTIDEVALYRRALEATEIAGYYAATR